MERRQRPDWKCIPMLTVAFHHCMLPFAISAIIHPLPSPTSPGRTFLRANNAPPRALSPFVRSPAQRWKKSSSLNLEQSRPTSYGILLFYNCVLDYDKGHQTGEGGITFSSSPPFLFSPPCFSFFSLLFHSYLNKRSLSRSRRREWNEDSSTCFPSLFLYSF